MAVIICPQCEKVIDLDWAVEDTVVYHGEIVCMEHSDYICNSCDEGKDEDEMFSVDASEDGTGICLDCSK